MRCGWHINIDELLAFHRAHGKIGTMSMYNLGTDKAVLLMLATMESLMHLEKNLDFDGGFD